MAVTITGDQNLIKTINKSIVLDSVKNNGPISRSQISSQTNLNKATVSTMVSELINEELVNEIGEGQSSGGRKPVMLYYNNRAGYSIGIDLGVNYILGILTDLSGNIIEESYRSLTDTTFESVTRILYDMIEQLKNKAPESPYGIIGIGVGVPGTVDSNQKILLAPNLEWTQVDLKQNLEQKFDIPTIIENEANSGAHAEHLYGAAHDVPNMIYVSIGIGIGTGIIINNKLYTGASGISGEMGHFTIETNGKKCRCGNRGCWELYASESTLFEEAKKLSVFRSSSQITMDEIQQYARDGNPEVIQMLYNISKYIGIGLTNIINTFNSDLIVIGNRFVNFEDWVTNPIKRILNERVSSYHRKATEVKFSTLGRYSCALGASSFAFTKFFNDRNYNISWK